MPFRERRITAHDGLGLHVRDYGVALDPRPALLCLGGLTRNSKDFADFAESRSRDGRRVICPDYRGRGRSDYDSDWRNYHPAVYLRDVRDILAALGVHRVVAVGTSLGGLLAMALGAAMPTALAAAVINDIGPEVETARLGEMLRFIGDNRPRRDWDEAVAATRTLLPTLGVADGEWPGVARSTFREGEDGLLYFDWDPNIVKPMLRRSYTIPDMWPLFGSLARLPVLLLRGERSDLFSAACCARMQDLKPDMTVREIPGAGHAPTLAEPESIEALDGFLARH